MYNEKNMYTNLHYNFLFISFLVISLFKQCNDFDIFNFFLFFAISLTKRAIFTTMFIKSETNAKNAENLKFRSQSKVFNFVKMFAM